MLVTGRRGLEAKLLESDLDLHFVDSARSTVFTGQSENQGITQNPGK